MKKDKKTIYADIDQLFNILQKEHKQYDLDTWYLKQLTRLEKQRGQLSRLLDNQTDFMKIISIQKIILDIDSKISNMVLRTKDIQKETEKSMFEAFNTMVEDYNKNENRKSIKGLGDGDQYTQGFKTGKFKLIKV